MSGSSTALLGCLTVSLHSRIWPGGLCQCTTSIRSESDFDFSATCPYFMSSLRLTCNVRNLPTSLLNPGHVFSWELHSLTEAAFGQLILIWLCCCKSEKSLVQWKSHVCHGQQNRAPFAWSYSYLWWFLGSVTQLEQFPGCGQRRHSTLRRVEWLKFF